jgi:subfamily B ATP-binding cassette protein MsbA
MVIVLALVAVGTGLCDGLKNYAFTQSAERALAEIRAGLFSRLRMFPLAYFQREQTGKIMSVLTNDAPAMAKLYQPVLGEACLSVLQLIAALTILSIVFGRLTLLAPVACGLYLLVPILTTPGLRRLSQKNQTLNADLSADLQESISATREVKAFGREDWDLKRLGQRFRAFLPLQRKIGALQIAASSNILIYWGIAAFFYWYGGRKVLAHEISLGSLFAMVWYFSFLDVPVRKLVGLNAQLQSALAAADRVFDLLERKEYTPVQTDIKPLSQITGRVAFDNLNFSYEAGKPVLIGIQFSAGAGERIGIAGPSGAGKSSLVNLILRLHPIESGCILIDGDDIAQVDLQSLRRQIGVVFQDTFLFNTSIRENIRFAKLDATDSEVLAAAKAAHADYFIMELPRGYDTVVGERGATLSGGQRQRIAIARAMLLDPRILILDEATSSLDSQAEAAVDDALEILMCGRTTFIVSHRLSKIADADRIIVLDQGRIIESGTHAELMNACGWYRQNYDLQGSADAAMVRHGIPAGAVSASH